ncbi:MAG TPA: ABC transporter permease [Candidatus Acidoferrales bacterium]|nr:ABC transporter permease [Candidatus Acidoferrales bacterium]
MRWIAKAGLRVRSLFHRRAVDRELDDEMQFHLERQIGANMQAGMTRDEARNAALREFGGVEQFKEECRDVRRANWLLDFLQDLRFGVRMLGKSRGFAAIAILTLALGIGANTAIFSLIDAVMLRTLPVRDPHQLEMLRWTALRDPSTSLTYAFGGCPGGRGNTNGQPPSGCDFSYPFFEQVSGRQELFSGVAAIAGILNFDVAAGGQVTLARGYLVSSDFFATLGTRAALGRMLDAADDAEGAPGAAVLSYEYWQSRFAGDTGAIGKTIQIERHPFTIVGVTERRFSGLDPGISPDMWIPLGVQKQINPYLPGHTTNNSLYLDILARLKPGVTAPQAATALSVMFANNATAGPDPMLKPEDKPRIEMVNVARGMTSLRAEYSQPLFVLMAAVGIILLIACANVGGLALARAAGRRKEIAMRFTLGANRGRIVRQLLTESLMISAGGAALGIGIAYWSADSLAAFLSANSYFPLDLNVAPDLRILAFTTAIAGLAGLLFGIAPALEGLRVDMASALRGAGGMKKGRHWQGRKRTGSLLVVGQVALSVVVIAGAGLLVHTLINLRTMNVGFQPNNVLLFNVDMSNEGYSLFGDPRVYPMDRELQARLAALPGVRSVGYSALPLLSGGGMTATFPPNKPGGEPIFSEQLAVGPGFLETMEIPLVAGRTFTQADFVAAVKPAPVVLNQLFARKFFGSANPVGQTFAEGNLQVIGVTADAKLDSLRKAPQPTIYSMEKSSGASFALRTSGNPKALIPLVRDVVHKVSGNLLVSRVETQEEQIDTLLYQERLVASLSALFGALALLLACIGLYGLLSYEVGRRTREIGIRMALGAREADVLRMVIRQGLALAGAGASIGVGTAWGVTRLMRDLLFEVKAGDPATFVVVVGMLGVVTALACYLPARRAMRVDPMVALRYE